MMDEQLAKYEAWAARLEENIASLTRQRRSYFRIFFGAWLGVGTLATGIMVCIAGLYISTTRTWEYQRELARTREEIAHLKPR